MSSPFREMMAQNKYNFENPAFIAEPVVGEVSNAQVREFNAGRLVTAATVTEIEISDNTVAIARDNPVYESADDVLRKHAGVVHNPIFEDDSFEEENAQEKNTRLWQRPDQRKFSKDFF